MTFTNLAVVSQSLSDAWTRPPYFQVSQTYNGSLLNEFVFLNSGFLTSTTPVTMLIITFKILSNSTASALHIVLSSESDFGTHLLSPDLGTQAYTTSDGSFTNCFNGPIPPAPTSPPRPAPTLPTKSHSAPPEQRPQNLTQTITLHLNFSGSIADKSSNLQLSAGRMVQIQVRTTSNMSMYVRRDDCVYAFLAIYPSVGARDPCVVLQKAFTSSDSPANTVSFVPDEDGTYTITFSNLLSFVPSALKLPSGQFQFVAFPVSFVSTSVNATVTISQIS